MSSLESIRERIFSPENRKPRTVLIKIFDQEVEVRQPTVAAITRMTQRADRQHAIVSILIEYCYVPSTNDRVFSEDDRDMILDLPTGQWLTDLNAAVADLTGVDVKAAEKNSEGTDSEKRLLQ
jgi:hypothetical protein